MTTAHAAEGLIRWKAGLCGVNLVRQFHCGQKDIFETGRLHAACGLRFSASRNPFVVESTVHLSHLTERLNLAYSCLVVRCLVLHGRHDGGMLAYRLKTDHARVPGLKLKVVRRLGPYR